MKKLRSKSGFTLAEMLMVVAIIIILTGVGFIAVNRYQRSLGQIERDGIAKEIFVAAQNHLSAVYGVSYFGATGDGSTGDSSEDTGKEVYYFTVNGSIDDTSILGQMLPFGAIDETVRIGGSYIVRYQKDTGLVLDVFYCSRNGEPARFNHTLNESEYGTVMGLKYDEKKDERKNFGDDGNAILGWYGGRDALSLPSTTLLDPVIKVVNAEKLYVEITDTNYSNANAGLKLIITGVVSGAKKAISLSDVIMDPRAQLDSTNYIYTVTLDDVTKSGMHFGDIVADTTEKFIPGEDIEIQAVAFSTSALSNIGYSSKFTTNSIFDSINNAKDTAYIANIRHLENLDKAVSNLDENDSSNKISISKAEQTTSFSWVEDFCKNIKKIETGAIDGYDSVNIVPMSGTATGAGYYYPINPAYELYYDGTNHNIKDLAVNNVDDAGLFGIASTVKEVKNLELIDFNISGNNTAGTLAGSLTGCMVTNVLARNSKNSAEVNCTAAEAGGLAGVFKSGTMQFSAAAVIVEGSSNAGGLVGTATGGTITSCYSGGHTYEGSYEKWVEPSTRTYDVSGGIVGGLVGESSATITGSYSTCSVSGTTAGGLAGSASGSIAKCYATGLVDSTGAKFAFLGEGDASLAGNYYYSDINKVKQIVSGKEVLVQMLPCDGYELNAGNMGKVKALDLNKDTYNTFTGDWSNWKSASVYDEKLLEYYGGKYCLETVQELNSTVTLPTGFSWEKLFVITHYGDWPSPEVFFIN